MASVIPVKEKKLMDVKLGELPIWILMWDFTPKGIAGAFQSGYYRYYKYVNVKKGGVAGVSMVLAAYVLFIYCLSYKEFKHEQRRKYHCRGPAWRSYTEPDLHLLGLAPLQRILLSTFISQSRIQIQ
ncbi:ATP synthase subunit f, mitochondrial [Tupaia chinensis]|uniref:ATP synthase F(0) complex subunit f, mitochondrial n=1 Tax=Tupaia chinensis TaxID=246437 RepID=L9K640_TUPCH|nr:ATP synthase subunit f, mitochondrial [Tupaia chinensis]